MKLYRLHGGVRCVILELLHGDMFSELTNYFMYALLTVSKLFVLNVRPLHRYINQILQAEEKDMTENSPGCSCFSSAVPSLPLGIKILDLIFLDSCVHLGSAHFYYHDDGRNVILQIHCINKLHKLF